MLMEMLNGQVAPTEEGIKITANLILNGATLAAVAGFIGKVWYANRKEKKEEKKLAQSGYLKVNGKDIGQIKLSLDLLSGNVNQFGQKLDICQTKIGGIEGDVKVIATEISGINQRCATHMTTQAAINVEVKADIKQLETHVYDIVKEK